MRPDRWARWCPPRRWAVTPTYSVVLLNGVQQISPIVAQILQNANGSGAPMPVVAGPVLAEMPAVTSLDVSVYPDEQLHLVDTQTNPATCWWWQRNDGEPRASTSVLSGPTIPVPADQAGKVVPMVKADKSGWQADRVFFGPDYANYRDQHGQRSGRGDPGNLVVGFGVRCALRCGAQSGDAGGVGVDHAA